MKEEKEARVSIWWFIGPACFIVFITAAYAFYNLYSEHGWDVKGQFGDTFGALNALFSGLAFAGVIYTILLQRKELKLTREELKKAAEAQTKSEEALRKQVKSMSMTALINGYTTFIQSIDNDLGLGSPDPGHYLRQHDLRSQYISKIELILDELYKQVEEQRNDGVQ